MLAPGIGHLDPQERVAVDGEAQSEVPARYAAMGGGVCGHLSHDVRG